VSIVVSLLGSFLFSFIIGYIQLMQEHLFSSGNVYTEKVALTLAYCKRHGIPQSLLYRISHFFDYCYRVRPFVGEAEILSAMSPSLRASVVLVMNDAVLARIPLFAAVGEEFQVGPIRCADAKHTARRIQCQNRMSRGSFRAEVRAHVRCTRAGGDGAAAEAVGVCARGRSSAARRGWVGDVRAVTRVD
jgi:hypothetical protein